MRFLQIHVDNHANLVYGLELPRGAVDATVFFDGSDPPFELGRVFSTKAISIPPGGAERFTLGVEASYSTDGVASALFDLLTSCLTRNEIEVTLKGSVTGDIGGGTRKLPVDFTHVTNCFEAVYEAGSGGGEKGEGSGENETPDRQASIVAVIVLASLAGLCACYFCFAARRCFVAPKSWGIRRPSEINPGAEMGMAHAT